MKTEERIDGPTPNGGTYCVAQYMSEDNEPVERARARKVEITEYDENDVAIFRTYGTL